MPNVQYKYKKYRSSVLLYYYAEIQVTLPAAGSRPLLRNQPPAGITITIIIRTWQGKKTARTFAEAYIVQFTRPISIIWVGSWVLRDVDLKNPVWVKNIAYSILYRD